MSPSSVYMITYRAIVEQLVEVSDNGYERHIEAVKRIATAYLKLLFPNVRSVKDINAKKFQQYCLRPAVRMREIIHKQLAILDKEYTKDEKQMLYKPSVTQRLMSKNLASTCCQLPHTSLTVLKASASSTYVKVRRLHLM